MEKKFAILGTMLSRAQAKKIVGGAEEEIGDIGVSCECKNGKYAGMKSCDTCERYCSTDNAFGGKDNCS